MNSRLQLRCWIAVLQLLNAIVAYLLVRDSGGDATELLAQASSQNDALTDELVKELAIHEQQFDDSVRSLEKRVGLDEPGLPLT